MSPLSARARAQLKVELFNRQHPVGTPVFYWNNKREGPGTASKTRAPAELFGEHTPIVWVEGRPDPIPLTLIKIVDTSK